jgi:hypothetical protein
MSQIQKASQAEWHCGPLWNEPPFEPELEEVGVAAAQLLMNTNMHHVCQNVITIHVYIHVCFVNSFFLFVLNTH